MTAMYSDFIDVEPQHLLQQQRLCPLAFLLCNWKVLETSL